MKSISTTFSAGPYQLGLRQSTGKGRPVIFLHGNSMSGLCFRKQLESELGTKNRLIALDLPGHGLSDAALNPEQTYSLPGYADALVSAVDTLGIADAVFAGWSLGGNVLLEAVARLPHARGFLIFGAPPLGHPPAVEKAFYPHPAASYLLKESLSDDEVRACAAACMKPGSVDDLAVILEEMKRTDGRCRSALLSSLMKGAYQDQIETVKTLSVPLAILHGSGDQLARQSYFDGMDMPTLWRGAVQTIEDAGHMPQWEQPERFNKLLELFLEKTAI